LLSLGAYDTKLYYGKGRESYSTRTGGVITVFCVLYVVFASIRILYQTFFWENFQMTQTYVDFSKINSTLLIKDLPLLLDFSI